VIDEKLLCFQAENYFQTKQYQKAEETYEIACNIVPSRFFPKYYLMNFYIKTNNSVKSIEVANKIIQMPEKISNDQSQLIKLSAKLIIDSLTNSHHLKSIQ
jgi:O-antigen polymerase